MLIDHASGMPEGNDTKLFNKTSALSSRSNNAQFAIKSKELRIYQGTDDLLPDQGPEVKKYLRLAGYRDKDIPALLDRTVGRVPKAAYLYKGLPKQKN